MCITPSPTQHCFAFLTWPKTSLTTTWWVYETCFSRSRQPRREKKFCPASANVRISNSVSRLLGSSLSLGQEIDSHAGLLHPSATSSPVRNLENQYHRTPGTGATPPKREGRKAFL